MSSLIDRLPETLTIDSTDYPINFGFRAFIMIENCMFDTDLTEQQRYFHMLNIFYEENIPQNIEEAFKQLTWFYLCGREPDNRPGMTNQKRVYAFDVDFEYIYAAFKTQYDIDLYETNNKDLHWWKFRSMFNSLKDDLMITKIMGYRVVDLKGMSKDQKKFYSKMKELYALKDSICATSKIKLSQRNKQMLDYVNKRYKGAIDEKD